MNIFDFPLYYISFKRNEELENKAKALGFANINHFQAIDGRKFEPKKLLEDDIITIRSYYDLVDTRTQHSGLPSLGAVGCTMSHNKLWQKCVDNNFPYIIILEDDVDLPDKITSEQLEKITNILSKEKSVYISSNSASDNFLFGTHFCILSNEACEELIKNTFPIDVQTDAYISHKNNTGKINVENFKLADQKSHKSSIQDICFKCSLPDGLSFYVIIIILILFILVLLFILFKGWKTYKSKFTSCSSSLSSCRSSK
jgi:GR25 family glycosyltransferase involved in LPS biosynthesis